MTDDTLQQRILKRWMHPRPQAGAHRSEQRVLDLVPVQGNPGENEPAGRGAEEVRRQSETILEELDKLQETW